MASQAKSDAFVFFGATGDLAFKKIFPALQALIRRGGLDVPIIGVAKSGWNLDKLRARARASLQGHAGGVDEAAFGTLIKLLRYVDGDYQNPATFAELRRQLGTSARPIHYLAIPPGMFSVVGGQLGRSGCAHGARVIVEKPFGRDLESARQLNKDLHAVFEEAAIFRIDHFLGKETVQNLLIFRFANTFLEPIWNKNYVQSVQITLAETFGVQGRGSFYDKIGAVRDVVQNHLMQVLGFLAMEVPATNYHESIRDELVKVLRQVLPLKPEDMVRGQFRGYREEAGVAKDSNTETYAALRLSIDSWRWSGVPFTIRAGKCLPTTATEVLVKLKRPPLAGLAPGAGNYVRFRLTPDLEIALGANIKKPGAGLTGEATELALVHSSTKDEMGAYERLLGDAMAGDNTLFAREDSVEAAWAVVDPVLKLAEPVQIYESGTWGPKDKDDEAPPIAVGDQGKGTASP